MTLIIIAAIIVVILTVAYLVMSYYPSFGGRVPRNNRHRLIHSPQYANGKFLNQIPTVMDTSLRSSLSILGEFIKGNPRSKPENALLPEPLNLTQGVQETKVTWFGHSAVLLEVNGVTLFIDPMLGTSPSPFPVIGGRRYSKKLPVEVRDLPALDAVLLSHDHYDHLDYGSIQLLKDKAKRFIVPLGVGAHLIRWGVEPQRIEEHDWWDEFQFQGLQLACTPARHFSGRSLLDRNSTLWCSWVIKAATCSIFFSGDSGYGPHFLEIGNKYGPFDLTLMECGQYDTRWAAIHMMPEQAIQAHLDVKGKLMIPIHWAAFTLALHDWTDPVERAWQAAKERGTLLATPRIGETVFVQSPDYPSSPWWR
ncbi:MBL fold metallo-hydrolase [Paenibacillus wynnii]|uniref:Membrane protein n=1 Tax=Paenibacillus wynnii TaxID=268407 RepID=A0A098MDT5_9BACL|nr:MBL fold metallo-hydrolase [Paenibacillus wynnii]KGE20218.1 membrane protein [Paenibacillus wynnii]